MKSKDLPALFLLVGLSVIISYMLSNLLLGKIGSKVTKVEVIDPISAEFNYENKPFYETDPLHPELAPINPTKDITLEENNNQNPLSKGR